MLKGREIAVVDVPDGKRGELLHLTVPVPAVEGLTGKHAIFLDITFVARLNRSNHP